ncbi:globin [Motiliproteus sp.]|uniref:globin n=1 Tax=Motiliproteus sp. TaxID=1898955 RepID=UPI003BA950C6
MNVVMNAGIKGVSNESADRVWRSYQRCLEDFHFLQEFYLRFIEASPEVAQKFANTDMDHQVLMLRASLDLMLGGDRSASEPKALRQIAKLHSRSGVDVPARLYDCWLESLLLTVARFDPGFDDELEQAWRSELEQGIAYMKAAY